MINILVVDDDKNIRKLLSVYLEQAGYKPICASSGGEALELMDTSRFDMVITDIMMPGIDGCELTADIRSADDKMPILIISAKDTFEDKRKGFACGTDDYMTKPLDLQEMSLRISALLRRAKISAERKIVMGEVCIDADYQSIITKDKTIELPKKEFDLIFKLLSYPKKIFTRRQLMDEIWGMESEADERTVDVHIKRLRERFEGISEFEIVTVRGLGYKAERRV